MELTTSELRPLLISLLENQKEGLHVKQLALDVYSSQQTLFDVSSGNPVDENLPSFEILLNKIQTILAADVKKKNSTFQRVINPKTKKPKKGFYKLYKVKPKQGPAIKIVPQNTAELLQTKAPRDTASTMAKSFEGTAGECAVMSELLFRGYNVNQFLVDDGVDVVASKYNVFYLVQVKTTSLDQEQKDRISVHIEKKHFSSFIGFHIRYVVVVRCSIQGVFTNLFFVFEDKDIDQFIYKNCILNPQDSDNISIKIRFKDGVPYIYHNNNEEDITFYQSRFL